uniref:Signal recognition particle subunit SRP68 n=1 Tax=Parascaris equorum TaxID=6256 RepID=A0A914RLI8_PAREQ
MATAETKEDIVLASFATLSILQLIKDAQQKHGLRHGDYQRYRGYCARRVRRIHAATKLEAQAYNAWMTGCFYFEMKQWKKALDFLKTARTIYEKLADVVKFPELIDLYKARCREIQPQMRYCEFNCGDDADTDAAVSEMINMRLQLGDGEGSLQDDFDKLISEMRTKATLDAECYIRWAGSIRDVMQSWNEEMKKAGGGGATHYFRAQTEKKVKPQDLLRLYDSVIEDCNEILRLPGASSNEQIKSAFLAKIEYYRAFRLILLLCDDLKTGR